MIIDCNYMCIIVLIGVFLFLLHNYGGLYLFITRDKEILKHLIEKFPAVSPDFLNKSLKTQNIENNQEIHEINKRLSKIELYINKLNTTITNTQQEETKENG